LASSKTGLTWGLLRKRMISACSNVCKLAILGAQ